MDTNGKRVMNMERIGEVTAVNGEWLSITFCRPTDCDKCHACIGGAKQTTIQVKGKAQLGEYAVVEMPERVVLKASAIAYVIPLLVMLAGMFLGAVLFPANRDTAALLGALIGLALSVGALMLTEKKRRNDPTWQPVLKEIVPRVEGVKRNGN